MCYNDGKLFRATRINSASASMACDGDVSTQLLKMLDVEILPLIKKL